MKAFKDYSLPPWKAVDFHTHFLLGDSLAYEAYGNLFKNRFGEKKWQRLLNSNVEGQKGWSIIGTIFIKRGYE